MQRNTHVHWVVCRLGSVDVFVLLLEGGRQWWWQWCYCGITVLEARKGTNGSRVSNC